MQIVQQTKTGLVIIDGNKQYADTFENALTDGGLSLVPLADQFDIRIYEVGKRHVLSGQSGAIIEGDKMPWPLGDALIAEVDTLLMGKKGREDAVLKELDDYREMQLAQSEAEAINDQMDRDAKTKADLDAYHATKPGLLDYLGTKRAYKQVAGFNSPTFGPILTDKSTVDIVGQLIQSFDKGLLTGTVNFKSNGGFVPLNQAQILAIAKEQVEYVQSCFNKEMEVLNDINLGTITNIEQIDQAFDF